MSRLSIARLDAMYQTIDYSGTCTESLAQVIELHQHRFENLELLAAVADVPMRQIRKIMIRETQFTNLDSADKIMMALGLNVSALVIIPAHQPAAARKMALDEMRTQNIAPDAELLDFRGEQLSLLRDRVLGEASELQKIKLERDRAAKRRRSDDQMTN